MMASREAAAPRPVVGRVTKDVGFNRFVWDVRHQNGLTMAPAEYEVRLKIGEAVLRSRFTVLIDPLIAEDGVTPEQLRDELTTTLGPAYKVATGQELQDEAADQLSTALGKANPRLGLVCWSV